MSSNRLAASRGIVFMLASHKSMRVAFGASAIIVGMVLIGMLVVWLFPVESGRRHDVMPTELGFALAVREEELKGIDKEDLREGLKEPPFPAWWLPLKDISLWYDTESQKRSLETDPAAFFQSMGLVGTGRDETYYVLVHASSDKSMWTRDMIWSVETAYADSDSVGRRAIIVELDNKGAGLMSRLSAQHVGEPMAVVFGDHVLSTPVITGPIDQRVMLQGSFTDEQFARLLRALAPPEQYIDSQADKIVRKAAAFLRDLPSLRMNITTDMRFTAEGITQQWSTKYSLAVQRPNKLALVLERGLMGSTIVSDGDKLHFYVPMMENKYTVEDAPKTLGEIAESSTLAEVGATEDMMFSPILFADDPYEDIMEGVRGLTYAGEVELDGEPCHLLEFFQEDLDWKLWIQTGERPLFRRIVADMARMYEDMPGFKSLKAEYAISFDDWAAPVELPSDQFVFVPPEGAEEVESFFEGFDFERVIHMMVGEPAPTFKLEFLEGGDLDLETHLGRDVVILDFWATWCAPCVRALPTLIKVAEAYKEAGVVFYAVNQGEEPETIRAFLEKKDLSLSVPLDRDGKVGDLYGVDSIPHTVLIGKDGLVQAVHVGFMPNLKSVLSGELDALLAGENLAEKALAELKVALEPEGLEPVWSVEERLNAVAADPGLGIVYATSGSGEAVAIDREGQVLRPFRIKDDLSALRAANLIGDAQRELLSFSTWGQTVRAHDTKGNRLWSYEKGQGIDDVWAADLDGDGLDEVIVGYNGSTGLHVLDNRGRVLWKYTGIGNVWTVCAGDVNGDGAPEVVTTSAVGQVHVFDAHGSRLKDLNVSCYASTIRVAAGPADADLLLVGGSAESEVLLVVGFNGREGWIAELPASIDSAQPVASKPWMALGLRGGGVYVVDITDGTIIAHGGMRGQQPQVGWLESPDLEFPLLVTADGRELRAFRVAASDR